MANVSILQKIDHCHRLELLLRLQPDRNHESWGYLASALFCHQYCYLISIDENICKNLLINAAFENRKDTLPYNLIPTLAEIVSFFKPQQALLFNSDSSFAGLYGNIVKKYFQSFISSNDNPLSLVVVESFEGMRQDKPYYVIDGMHRLVAFGLQTGFAPEYFPKHAYYCTDQDKFEVSLEQENRD